MALIYVQSSSANPVKLLDGTTIGLVPTQVDNTSFAIQTALQSGSIISLPLPGESSTNGVTSVSIGESQIIVPVDIQSIYRKSVIQPPGAFVANGGSYDSTTPNNNAGVDMIGFSQVRGRIVSDQNGTLQFYESDDNVNWDIVQPVISITGSGTPGTAGTPVSFSFPMTLRYLKYVLSNTGTATQQVLRVSVYGCVN